MLTTWNADMMGGAAGTTLDHVETLGMDAMKQGYSVQSQKPGFFMTNNHGSTRLGLKCFVQTSSMWKKKTSLLLLLLSRFSRVRLCATPQTAAHQAPLWDSPGKNTGVGCHFLLQRMKAKCEGEVAQSCLTLCDPMDCSPPGSSVYGTFQARVLEWGAIAFSEDKLKLMLV